MKTMKNGYSKISSSNGSGQKSRSMDFSSSSAAAAAPPQNPKPSPPSRRKEGSSSSASSSTTHHRGSRPEHEDEEPAADIRNKPPQVMPVVVKTPQQQQQQQQQQRHETELDLEWEGAGNGEKFGVILGRRSGSVSSSSACVMKRAFSMRRSSSVSERYCRIHDQQYIMAIASPPLEEAETSPPLEEAETEADAGGIGTTTTTRSQKKLIIIRRGANIFKACKRLLRL